MNERLLEYTETDPLDRLQLIAIFVGDVRYYNLTEIQIGIEIKQPRQARVAALLNDNTGLIQWIPERDLPDWIDPESVPRYKFEDANELHDLISNLNNSSTYYEQPLAHPNADHPQIPKTKIN